MKKIRERGKMRNENIIRKKEEEEEEEKNKEDFYFHI